MALNEVGQGGKDYAAVSSAQRSQHTAAARRRDRTAYLFLAPYLVLFTIFTLAPAMAGVGMSFTHWDILGPPSWAGLANYRQIVRDSLFWQSIGNTFYFMLLTAVPLIVMGLALALLLNQRLRGRAVVRTVVVLPYVVMVSAVGIIWVWIYDTNYGLLNYYLGKLAGALQIGWLTEGNWAMPALALTMVWWSVNTNMIIYLAGLQDIPEELYDAAKIDGAGRWSLFRFITFPLLLPVNAFVIPLTIIASWRAFGLPFVMTKGGPEGHTFVIAQYIYLTAFQNFQMGPAAAAAVVLLLITLIFTVIQLRTLRVL